MKVEILTRSAFSPVALLVYVIVDPSNTMSKA